MILIYHNVYSESDLANPWRLGSGLSFSAFERQIRWLAAYCRIVSMDEYLESWHRPKPSRRKTVALTFDDGLGSTFHCVFPLLLELNVPATFFVTTCHLNHGELLWFSYLNGLCFEKLYDSIEIDGCSYPFGSLAQCKKTRYKLDRMVKAGGAPADFTRALAQKYPLPSTVKTIYEGMTFDQLRIAGSSKLIELGAHTATHPYLDRLPKDLQLKEIVDGNHMLSAVTGKQVRYFAYPGGEYNVDTLALVKSTGYQAAFAVIPKGLGADRKFEISRVGVYSQSLFKLGIKASGGVDFARKLGVRAG